MKQILILGGSYAGISTAHRILKHANKATHFKITLVCPNTHMYWNMASTRGVIPGQLTDEQLFHPIAVGFKGYAPTKFELVHGHAESLDFDYKTVQISGTNGSQKLDYDFLILATGAHTKGDTPFKMLGSTEATKDILHEFQARVKKAKKIIVAGAGLTGVEFAGELAFEYGPDKEVVLLASGPTVLDDTPLNVSSLATKELRNLGVEVKLQTRVVGSATKADGQQEISTSGGETLAADLYVPTFGLIPNSSYIPSKFLDDRGYVMVNDFLQVRNTESVWAIGDVSDMEPPQFKVTDTQSAHLAKNIVSIMSNREPVPYNLSTPFRGVSIGRKAGTGHFGTWKIPSFVIVMARKNLFLDNMGPTVDGSLF